MKHTKKDISFRFFRVFRVFRGLTNYCKIAVMKTVSKTPFVSAFAFTVLVIGFAGVNKVIGSAYLLPQQNLPTQTTKATPKPSVSPTPAQTLENLQSKIRERLLAPEVRRGRVGVKIVSLKTGKVIFENDAEKYFIPASNMKNFTVAAALEKLGPDFRFVTSVYANAKPDAVGTIKGDLRIFGRGDITISTAFNNGDYYKGIDNLVDKIAAAGVKRIEGDLMGDESYFKGNAVPYTWEWDDLQWYDGAEVSALPVNNNAVDLTVKQGASVGSPCFVTVLPQTSLMPVLNNCKTGSANQPRTLKVFKPIGRNALEISGAMPIGDKGFIGYVAITHPAEMFMELLKQRLRLKNILIAGKTRLVPSPVISETLPVEITRLESPPLSAIAAQTMKLSQNMFTETILWTLGEHARERATYIDNIDVVAPRKDSSQWGLEWAKTFLDEIGLTRDTVLQYDGSGMSRHNQVTPSAVVTLYTYMAKQSKYKQAWLDSLTVGGVDGTLKRRFTGSTAEGNVRGKTGTLDQVSALSGYLTTAAGEQLVVSVIVNGVAEPRTRTSLIDDIIVHLANFNGEM
jgi:serine-type D-Ala-D-Ala carboxypeptidase/endopeptidase (penicillin-binding protein 4)